MKGGTLESLVEYLLKSGDKDFVDTFLMSYTSFCSYSELLEEIQKLIDKELNLENKTILKQAHEILFAWLKTRSSVYDEFNQYDLFQKMNSLIAKLPTSFQLKEILSAEIEEYQKPPPAITLNKLDVANKLSNMKVEAISEQLCLLDHYLLASISIKEFENQNWNNSGSENNSPNISRIIKRFNSIFSYVVFTILIAENSKERNSRFSKFVSLFGDLLSKNNFFSARAVCAALDSTPIRNLKASGHMLKKERDEQKIKEFDALFSKKNGLGYRSQIKNCYESDFPCIPFLGVHLQDLTFMDDGNVNRFKNGHINFKKRTVWAGVVKTIKKFQETKYNFEKNEEFFQQLYYISGFSESQLDEIVVSIKNGKSGDFEDSISVAGSNINLFNQTKTLKNKKLVILRIQEQSNIGGKKRIDVWKSWIKSLQSEVKDIACEKGNGFLSFIEVFLQSKAIPLLINKIIQEFPEEEEEFQTFRELLKVIFVLKDEKSLEYLINFLRICYRYKDELTVKDKVKICIIITSFTARNQLFDQEKVETPCPIKKEDIDASVQEITKAFTSFQYLDSEDRQLLVKNFNILIHHKEKGNVINEVFDNLCNHISQTKERYHNEIKKIENSKNKYSDDKKFTHEQFLLKYEQVKEEEIKLKEEIKLLTLKLHSLKEQKQYLEVRINNHQDLEPEFFKPMEEKINNDLLPKINEENQLLESLKLFSFEYYTPNIKYIESNFYSEDKKKSLKEWIISNIETLFETSIVPTFENMKNNKTSFDTQFVMNLIKNVNHLLVIGDLFRPTFDQQCTILFEKINNFSKDLKQFYKKFKTNSISENLFNKLENNDSPNLNPSEQNKYYDLDEETEISLKSKVPQRDLFSRSSSSSNLSLDIYSLSNRTQSVSSPSTPKSRTETKGKLWKPPLHIHESEPLLNKNISKMEQICLEDLKQLVSPKFTDEILLRILRKVGFFVEDALKIAKNYELWHNSNHLEFSSIFPSLFLNFSQQHLLCLTNSHDISGRSILFFKWNEFQPQKVDPSEFSIALMYFFEKLSLNTQSQIFGFTFLIVNIKFKLFYYSTDFHFFFFYF